MYILCAYSPSFNWKKKSYPRSQFIRMLDEQQKPTSCNFFIAMNATFCRPFQAVLLYWKLLWRIKERIFSFFKPKNQFSTDEENVWGTPWTRVYIITQLSVDLYDKQTKLYLSMLGPRANLFNLYTFHEHQNWYFTNTPHILAQSPFPRKLKFTNRPVHNVLCKEILLHIKYYPNTVEQWY